MEGKMKKPGKRIVALLVLMVLLTALSFVAFRWILRKTAFEQKTFTAFMAVPGEEKSKDNRIRNKIAELTGVRAEIEWLGGQTPEEKIDSMIQQDEYPDFINGADASNKLIEAGALIPLDDYLEDYPDLYHFLTPKQWESMRKEDGHIYYIPPFGVVRDHNTQTMISGEAFWIQKRVLEWAGFPEVKTLDEYFDYLLP